MFWPFDGCLRNLNKYFVHEVRNLSSYKPEYQVLAQKNAFVCVSLSVPIFGIQWLEQVSCQLLKHPNGHNNPKKYTLSVERVPKMGVCSTLRKGFSKVYNLYPRLHITYIIAENTSS